MKTDELIMALQKLKVQTVSLACLGCGHEHNCAWVRDRARDRGAAEPV